MNKTQRLLGIVITASALGLVSAAVTAQPGPGSGPGSGPGMMGGYGGGPGAGRGYGPGNGPGYGSGYGPGYGYGMGQGMGMGRGMMGMGNYSGLDLSKDQRSKISQIQKEVRAKHFALMSQMIDAREALQDLYDEEKQDAAAISAQYKAIDEARRQLIESSIDVRNRVNAILTKEQREKLRESGRRQGGMMWGY